MKTLRDLSLWSWSVFRSRPFAGHVARQADNSGFDRGTIGQHSTVFAVSPATYHRSQAVGLVSGSFEEGYAMATQGPSPALFFDTISAYQRTEALRAAI